MAKCLSIATAISATFLWFFSSPTDWTRAAHLLGEGSHTAEWVFWCDSADRFVAGWHDMVSLMSAGVGLLPELQDDVTASAVSNATESIGFADASVMDAIGRSVTRHIASKGWANTVKDGNGNPVSEASHGGDMPFVGSRNPAELAKNGKM